METYDRFISQRNGDDAALAFTTKVQLFSSPNKYRQRSSSSERTTEPEQSEECDSKRTYQALLQN